MASLTLRFLVFLSLVLVLPPPLVLTGGSGGGGIFADAIPEPELEALVAALRERGYHLFPNAIMTSDLHLRLLDGPAFTIFAPTDSALFSLDMTSTSASDYFRSLLFHVSPLRLTLSSLRSLPSPTSFPSLLVSSPHHLHHHSSPSSPRALDHHNVVSVDGIDVLLPGIFYGPHVAVHGLDGIFDVRQSYVGSSPPTQHDYVLPYPAARSPQPEDRLPSPPPGYAFPWSRSEAPATTSTVAQSPATFPEENFPIGYGSFSSSPKSSDPFLPEFRSATSTGNCRDGDATLGVVDGDGSEKSGAASGGLYEEEEAVERAEEPGYPGEKRKRIFLAPAVLAPSSQFEVISVSSEPPMFPKNECPAVSGEDDSDAMSAAAKCGMMAEGEDYPVPTSEDIEISYEDALRGGPIQHQKHPDDLL